MRKWQDLAAPDDPNSWFAISNMWPTKRGTYETADTSAGTQIAVNSGDVLYAFAAKLLNGSVREYVVCSANIWEYTGGSLTDRTGGVAIGTISHPMMAQYGNITICVMGATVATVSSAGANFAALAGAPKAEIIVVQSNAVVVFNTDTSADGWAASDVGDYTNWVTGEAASGRIFTTPGPILAAVAFGNDIIVFKRSAIYRMTYVGGVLKWLIQIVWRGMGCAVLNFENAPKYAVAACARGVAFNAALNINGVATGNTQVYLFDGASRPKALNPLTTIPGGWNETLSGTNYKHDPVFFYDPVEDVLCIADFQGANNALASKYYYYSFPMDAWGSGGGASDTSEGPDAGFGGGSTCGVLQGDYYAQATGSSKPVFWRYKTTAAKPTRCAPSAPVSTSTCSLQSSMYGRIDRRTTWDRATPRCRRRTSLGADSASATLTLYAEPDGNATTTRSGIAEYTGRRRFNLTGGTCVDCFARVTVAWTALDIEVDDFLIKQKDAGED